MEVDEVPNEGDLMPFPGEDAVTNPSSLGLGVQGHRDVRAQIFQYLCTLTYVGIWICTLQPRQKQKK
jgi:hypothetical protein